MRSDTTRLEPDPGRRGRNVSMAQVCDVARAALFLADARVTLAVHPSSHIITTLREKRVDARHPTPLNTVAVVNRIAWAIAAAAPRVPWRADCLIRVIAAQRWLRHHGLEGEFHLGVAKDDANAFKAHAWLTCAGTVVAGGSGDGFELLIGPGASHSAPAPATDA